VRRRQRARVRVRRGRRQWFARRAGRQATPDSEHKRVAHQAPVVILGQVLGTAVQERLVSHRKSPRPSPHFPV